MKRPLAYITAAWCGEDYKNTEQAARYCRAVYEAGFSPICPTLYLPLFLNDAVPEEHKSGIDMSRDLLRRSHVLVVCGHKAVFNPGYLLHLHHLLENTHEFPRLLRWSLSYRLLAYEAYLRRLILLHPQGFVGFVGS